MYEVFNRTLEVGTFPSSMKLESVARSRLDKGNYRPVSILPNLPKVFERGVYRQMSKFFYEILSKYQCGFRRGHRAQHCLIALLKKWGISVDQGLEFGALLTELSMALDSLPHNLLLDKLSAYEIHMTTLIHKRL